MSGLTSNTNKSLSDYYTSIVNYLDTNANIEQKSAHLNTFLQTVNQVANALMPWATPQFTSTKVYIQGFEMRNFNKLDKAYIKFTNNKTTETLKTYRDAVFHMVEMDKVFLQPQNGISKDDIKKVQIRDIAIVHNFYKTTADFFSKQQSIDPIISALPEDLHKTFSNNLYNANVKTLTETHEVFQKNPTTETLIAYRDAVVNFVEGSKIAARIPLDNDLTNENIQVTHNFYFNAQKYLNVLYNNNDTAAFKELDTAFYLTDQFLKHYFLQHNNPDCVVGEKLANAANLFGCRLTWKQGLSTIKRVIDNYIGALQSYINYYKENDSRAILQPVTDRVLSDINTTIELFPEQIVKLDKAIQKRKDKIQKLEENQSPQEEVIKKIEETKASIDKLNKLLMRETELRDIATASILYLQEVKSQLSQESKPEQEQKQVSVSQSQNSKNKLENLNQAELESSVLKSSQLSQKSEQKQELEEVQKKSLNQVVQPAPLFKSLQVKPQAQLNNNINLVDVELLVPKNTGQIQTEQQKVTQSVKVPRQTADSGKIENARVNKSLS
jgi:hypothetical protein